MENLEKNLLENDSNIATEATSEQNTASAEETDTLEEAVVAEAEAPVENTAEEAPAEETAPEAEQNAEPESAVSAIEELRALAAAEAEQWDYMPKPVGKLKRRQHPYWRAFFTLLIIFIILFFVAAESVFGKGWIINRLGEHGDNKIDFTLPIAELPKLETEYYQASGKYTTEGVAKAVLPSIVTIEAFVEGSPLAAYSQGSGVIMSSDGYIITNAHVIEEASLAILVRLHDGTEYDATIVGSDIKSDLAVIKIQAQDLQAAQFGNSDSLVLGEQVIALGSPAGLEGTVTMGIVSGLDRMIRVDTDNIDMSCIQIDAAINPGNSGGALVNMWGQVVGITSSKMDSIEFDNIGFAIEMSAATPIIEQLIENGRVLGRPKIGISFYEISDAYGDMYDMPGGLYIAEIDLSCDIANTRLMVDDIIIKMNGIDVRSASDVYAIIMELEPGDMMTASVLRPLPNGEYEEFEIEFRLMEDNSDFVLKEDAPMNEEPADPVG